VEAEMPEDCDRSLVGTNVVICGLKSSDHMNGQHAEIVRYSPVSSLWEARFLRNNEVMAFRAENIRPRGEKIFLVGDTCVIDGLVSQVGQQMNGQRCTVLQYLQQRSRYEVQIGDQIKALKGENLQAAS